MSIPYVSLIVESVDDLMQIEREDSPLYPMEALREALANAICHRDYSLSGSSVGVAIFDDRLEITNTGTLPPGITIEDLTGPHTSQIRNDLIADAFYRRGIIEQWGRGTTKMAGVGRSSYAFDQFVGHCHRGLGKTSAVFKESFCRSCSVKPPWRSRKFRTH